MFLFPFANYGILKTQISMGLAPEKASRVKAWLQGRQPYLATPDP
jgi:hypothetical protein